MCLQKAPKNEGNNMRKQRVAAGFLMVMFVGNFPILLAQEQSGAVSASTASLTFSQVVERAVQINLVSLLAKANTEEARGGALESASDLLPHIMGSASQARIFKVNLEAQGFPANNPFFAPLIGPFNNFDARIRLV